MKLLELFTELSLHPKNAAELKGLILQLAVQGKLTAKWREEYPDVEPASELLKRIEEEKERLIKEGKIKKEKVIPEIKENEEPCALPEKWKWLRLGTITYNFGQKTPDIPFEYIDVASIDNSLGIIKHDLNVIEPSNAPSRARKKVQKGCVIYSTVRPYLLNIACVDRDFNHEAIASTAFAVLNPFVDMSAKFLYLVLRSPFFVDYVESCMKGVAYPAINDQNLLSGPIPLPPVKEQHAIVTTVNQLFGEVEQLEQLTQERIQLKHDFATSALQRLVQAGNINGEWAAVQQHFHTFFNEKPNVKKLRETILQLAVQGKLTTHWRRENPDTEPATELLKRITTEKQQLIQTGKIKKEKPLPPIKEDEIPFELPEGWVWCRLGDAGFTQTGNTPPKNIPDYFGDFIPFIGPANISNQRIVYPTEGLSKKGLKVGRLIPRNSIMMVCIGGSIGKCNINEIDVSCNQQINTITPLFNLPGLINFICQSPFFQDELINKSTGSATPIINKGKWELIPIPIPPYQEQHAIVATVNTLMALCDALEQEVRQQESRVEELMRSCVREVVE